MKARPPENETDRLDALCRYSILDTLTERDSDELAFLARLRHAHRAAQPARC